MTDRAWLLTLGLYIGGFLLMWRVVGNAPRPSRFDWQRLALSAMWPLSMIGGALVIFVEDV